ncbi:MAG: hypothetical protein J7K15_10265 [Deltaproteobacteria bacterium]|nr:hypothetical protein [Deltaproteobacteria bacterium]
MKGGYIEESEYPVIFQGTPIDCINYLRRVADRAEKVIKKRDVCHKVTLVFKHEPEPLTSAGLTAELTIVNGGVSYTVRYAIVERGPESCIKFLTLIIEETVWERKELFLPPK